MITGRRNVGRFLVFSMLLLSPCLLSAQRLIFTWNESKGGYVAAVDTAFATLQASNAQKLPLHGKADSAATAELLQGKDTTWVKAQGGGGPAFPVGSVFLSVLATNPATLLGYGTWVAIGAGRVLVGLDAEDVDFDTAEETGGAKTIASTGTVSQPTFTGSEMATHQHAAITAGTPAGTISAISGTATGAVKIGTSTSSAAAQTHTHPAPTFTGSVMATHQHAAITAGTPAGTVSQPTYTGNATSVVQPYLVVYMWKRTQ